MAVPAASYLSAARTQWSASPSQAAAISVFVISIGSPTPTCQIQPRRVLPKVERQTLRRARHLVAPIHRTGRHELRDPVSFGGHESSLRDTP